MTRARTLAGLTFSNINSQTSTSYTFAITDINTFVTLSNASTISLTIPKSDSVAFPVGAVLNFSQNGTGQVTVSGASGVTVTSTGATASTPKTRVNFSAGSAVQISVDNWLVIGDIV